MRSACQIDETIVSSIWLAAAQPSVWITPDSIEEQEAPLRARRSMGRRSRSWKRVHAAASQTRILCPAHGTSAGFNGDYEIHLDILDSMPRRTNGKAARNWFAVECKAWRRASGNDSLLPEPLLPAGYRGREAWRRRTELRELLNPA
jgi:hypothetical protein